MPARVLFVIVLLFLTASVANAQIEGALKFNDVDLDADVEYAKVGDISLKVDVLTPKTKSDKPRPVIVFIHGGGWQSGNKRGGVFGLRPLVATGDYVGVSVQYRLTDVASWPAQIHDCKAAIRWVRANAAKYGIDPERIGVWGGSAGGHLVSLLGTSGGVAEIEGDLGTKEGSSRVQCVVDFCGPSDFLAFDAENPKLKTANSAISKLLGGPLREKQEVAKQASPITYVTKDDPPFLVVHGTADAIVPVDQADRFHKALTAAGVDSKYVRIVGGSHSIGGPEVAKRVRAFFDKHLLGKDVEVSDAAIEVK